tara:strand:+ start:450 stop:584 length:135 start_codon:yes stop_codon:yes gene_type:complete
MLSNGSKIYFLTPIENIFNNNDKVFYFLEGVSEGLVSPAMFGLV